MDAATVLGAWSIAYALRFIRAATQGGIEIRFYAKTASLTTTQTVKDVAELLLNGSNNPEEEIDKVTMPKSRTIVGVDETEHQGFGSSLANENPDTLGFYSLAKKFCCAFKTISYHCSIAKHQEALRASAPATISRISLVIAAWRVRL